MMACCLRLARVQFHPRSQKRTCERLRKLQAFHLDFPGTRLCDLESPALKADQDPLNIILRKILYKTCLPYHRTVYDMNTLF